MNLLDVVNINDCERIFKCHHTRTYYKMENNELLFRKENVEEWSRSTITIGELREYNVGEMQEGRKTSCEETYYFIDDEGSVAGDEEDFSIVDDNRYEFGNYFESKEEAERCRDFVKKAIRIFKQKNKEKKELEKYIEIKKDCKYLSCNGDCMLN